MKVSIASRLKQIMSEQGLKQVDILNKTLPLQTKHNVRLAKNDLSQYVNGKVEPNQERIFILSKALDVSEAWLMGFDVPRERINKEDNVNKLVDMYQSLNDHRKEKVYSYTEKQLESQNKVIHIRENNGEYITEILRGYLSAGTGEMQLDEISEEIEIPVDSLPGQPYDMVLQVNGDSMLPMFKDKERVFIRKLNEPSELRNGQIGVFIIDGESFLKKAYKEDKQLRLVSLNDKYNDLIFDKDNNIGVIGTVVM